MLQDLIRMDRNKRGCLGLAGTMQAKECTERTGDRRPWQRNTSNPNTEFSIKTRMGKGDEGPPGQ